MTQPAGESVEVVVPRVPQDADVYRSWRQVVTGVDERAEGREAVLGPEVGHGATVAVWPGTVLLVVDQRIVRWERAYTTYDTYPVLDADVALLLVLPDATLKPLWTRHFKTARGAFGPTGLGQVRKHSAAHPVPGDGGADKLVVRETAPGPGRPNYKSGPCRWCGETVRPLCHRFDVASAAPEKR